MSLTQEEIALFKSVNTAEVSDAMEELELRRTLILGFRLIAPEGTVVVGSALTIQHIPKRYPHVRSDKLIRTQELATDHIKPGNIVVMDHNGRLDICSWGDRHSIRVLNRGGTGLLMNGAIRDVHAIRKIGFPVFCLGFTPLHDAWDYETVAINGPVVIGGVQIMPDDIIIGDEDGILVIPKDLKTMVLEKSLQLRKIEEDKGPPV
jgi:4-hydroxy-4-methyl-2-oxoglutarate aldolase